MKRDFFSVKRVRVILALALFNFIFLGTEYLFDNMMALVTDSGSVVLAQGYVLGASVIGFIIFPVVKRFIKENIKNICVFAASILSIICVFIIQQHASYELILIFGCIAFVIFGVTGSAVHYMAACELKGDASLAKTVGFAYAFGLLLQFINNNLVNNDTIEAIVISIFIALFVVLFMRPDNDTAPGYESPDFGENEIAHPLFAGSMLIIIVALMTCVFSTLDNAVTLFHAAGSMDIGQWPRLLLAASGIVAGILFDIKDHRYMNIIMYCVTLLSTICVLIIVSGGTFLIGLIVFYLSAGFFVVFFTTGFIDLSYKMKVPEFWAGLGRPTNNICSVITGAFSLKLIESANSILISIIALILFALISVAIFVYSNQIRNNEAVKKKKDGENSEEPDEVISGNQEDKFVDFAETFVLTDREQEVLKLLLTSDESVQEMADKLFISRAALYRHISSLNEKTETKSRIGLLQFYYSWAGDKMHEAANNAK